MGTKKSVHQISPNPVGNKLLAALPREEYKCLWPYLEPISLPFKQCIHEPNEPIDYVYFLNSGVASVLTVLTDGGIVEVATIGNEGMVGTPVLLGTTRFPAEVIAQIPGDALRMRVDVFKRQVVPGSSLHNLLLRYTQALMNLLAQSVACNRLHSVEERCCRWLLLTHDRVESDEFPLTQEFLAQMLGVRRASVSQVAAILQKAGLIRYHRGRLRILDRQGLEAGSCECYQIIKEEFNRLLC
ncbi:MAG: Crp/Fnr family transcriptional regulator [Coleofasciculaceae cyanobacterium]